MRKEPNPYLVLTSLLFLIPTTTTAYYRQWVPYSANVLITFASSIYHTTKDPRLLILDKASCWYLTVVNVYNAIQEGVIVVPAAAGIYCIVVFQYGYFAQKCVFAPSPEEALRWHMSMHLVVMLALLYKSLVTGHEIEVG